MTLDCCRTVNKKGRGTHDYFEVELCNREPIAMEDQEKIAVLYGSMDDHSISDDISFT